MSGIFQKTMTAIRFAGSIQRRACLANEGLVRGIGSPQELMQEAYREAMDAEPSQTGARVSSQHLGIIARPMMPKLESDPSE